MSTDPLFPIIDISKKSVFFDNNVLKWFVFVFLDTQSLFL